METLFEPHHGPKVQSSKTLLDLILDHYDELNRLLAMESSADES